MALLPTPFNFPSSSSTNTHSNSLNFCSFHPQKIHSLKSFKAQKLVIPCCQQTVQLDSETQLKNSPVKKKRKPRPSFLEQIQDKWSLKTPSLRENFPWQQEKEEQIADTNKELKAQRSAFPNDVSSEKVSVKISPLIQPVSSDVEIKSRLAPWVHGNESKEKQFNSQSKTKFREKGIESENLVKKEMKLDAISKEKYSKFDDTPIRFSDKKEILTNEVSENPISPKNSPAMVQKSSARLPWESQIDDGFENGEKLRKKSTDSVERLIPENELKRLRNLSLRMFDRIKVGSAGVNQALVDAIHSKWKHEEVVKLKFEGPPSMNMKRIHETLESRTGGLVIYRSGTSVVLYRGMTYNLDCVKSYSKHIQESSESSKDSPPNNRAEPVTRNTESSRTSASNDSNDLSNEEQIDLNELNLLLDGLGPRFIDWTGREPLPVDADLLPSQVPNYTPPFRRLPFGIKLAVTNKDMTYLRNTARIMPPHFALGRSRELQGLATAMVNLWKKSAIAKIAIKRGVLNTNNERMAEELKKLTGGTLLSRNKEYIVFYRGNDFLPPVVSNALIEAEKRTSLRQDEEEEARYKASNLIDSIAKSPKQTLIAGTLAETVAATSRWGNQPSSEEIEKMKRDLAVAKRISLINSLEKKLALAKGKIRRAERVLTKVHENREPMDLPSDLETLSNEERFLFRKIGLSMKPYLLLGRREVFDGTIENMHLHWKHRELVKIIVDRKKFLLVKHVAVSLEAESGGVLVSVDKTTKGYAIIIYRGKNYRPPAYFRPKNLLTKRQALARAIELQRREALKHHVLDLEEEIEKMKLELEDINAGNEINLENSDLSLSDASDDDDYDEMESEEDEMVDLHKHECTKMREKI